MADEGAPPLDALLAQRAWVRALARTLVRDDAAADDLAQEAWLAALRSPPRGAASVRGWFSAVLRNAARQAHRGGSRRERREAESARPEDGGAAAQEVVARAEEHRRVVDAVLALEEPYRTTVLLRFLDDLPPREVAERTGVPVETVRARVRRALERLRVRLDEAHGGDGTAWRAALLPLAGLRWETAPVGAAAGGDCAGSGALPRLGTAGAKSGAASGTTSALTSGAIGMGTGATLAVGGAALLAGAAAGWLAGAGDRDALERARAELAASQDDVAGLRADADKLRADGRAKDEQVVRLKASLDAAAKERETAAADADRLRSSLEETREALAKLQPAAPRAGDGPAFAFPEYGDVFEKLDWRSVGEHIGAMPALLEEIVLAQREKRQPSAKAIGDVQKHNGPLVTIAVDLMRSGKLSGEGANGAFTHPAFAVNALAATLQQLGMPLSDEQRTRLEAVGRRFTGEEAQRVAAYGPETFQLQKLAEEGALKARSFEATREVLTREQLDAVSPPSGRDRVRGDLWSAAIFWIQFAQPAQFATTQELTDDTARILTNSLRVPAESQEKARQIVADWVAHLPQPLREREVDEFERLGMMPAPTVQLAAESMRTLVERFVRELNLEGASLTAARKFGFVPVPTPASAKDADE